VALQKPWLQSNRGRGVGVREQLGGNGKASTLAVSALMTGSNLLDARPRGSVGLCTPE